MSETAPVVIVGAGHGGVQAAASLREEGYDGKIVLLSAEPHLPYQRPPLSKAFLKREIGADALPLRGEACNRNRKMKLPMEKECWFFFSLLSPKRNLPYLLACRSMNSTLYYTNSKTRVQPKAALQ